MAFKISRIETRRRRHCSLVDMGHLPRSDTVLDETVGSKSSRESVKADLGRWMGAVKGVRLHSRAEEALSAGADLSMLEGNERIFISKKRSRPKGEIAANQMAVRQTRPLFQVVPSKSDLGQAVGRQRSTVWPAGGFEADAVCHYRVGRRKSKNLASGLPEVQGPVAVPRLPPAANPARAAHRLRRRTRWQLFSRGVGDAIIDIGQGALNLIH